MLAFAAFALVSTSLAVPAQAQNFSAKELNNRQVHRRAVEAVIWGMPAVNADLMRQALSRVGATCSGPEVFEAMAAGKHDVLSAGGVISNYLALGHGRAFLINDIEIATAQLWVRPDKGVRTFADLKGKPIATTAKTTAHIFLDRALRANNLAFADIELRNSSMSAAVASFIAGEVPAVALWVPFNIAVREKLPGAVKLVDASAFYPQSAVVGGWAARSDYYAGNKEVSTPASIFRRSDDPASVAPSTRFPAVSLSRARERQIFVACVSQPTMCEADNAQR